MSDARKSHGEAGRGMPSPCVEVGLLGFGLDGTDGHQRITQGNDFCLLGGSSETHDRMQEIVVRMSEQLRRKGKRFSDLSNDEFADLAADALD